MKVLILSPYPERISKSLKREGDEYLIFNEIINVEYLKKNKIDFVISYGYKYIISESVLNYMKNAIINLHISYLPFNRGCYPNLWSHIDSTPSGVSIHRIDKGIDTGEVLLRKKVFIKIKEHNFSSSYDLLRNSIDKLFDENWKYLRFNQLDKLIHIEKGSYHNKMEGEKILKQLKKGWETNIYEALKVIKKI